MGQAVQNEGMKAFTAGEDLSAYRRVKLSSGEVVYADADEAAVGITQNACLDGESVTVRLITAGKTFKVEAGEAITTGSLCYGLADGKVGDTDPGAGLPRFRALQAASGTGSIIEVEPIIHRKEALLTKLGITDANAAAVTIMGSMPAAFQITDYWLIARDTTAANISLLNAGTLVSTAVLAKGTTDAAIVRAATLLAAQDLVAAGAALTVSASAAAAFDIFVAGYFTT
jgi:hypothetical protein